MQPAVNTDVRARGVCGEILMTMQLQIYY